MMINAQFPEVVSAITDRIVNHIAITRAGRHYIVPTMLMDAYGQIRIESDNEAIDELMEFGEYRILTQLDELADIIEMGIINTVTASLIKFVEEFPHVEPTRGMAMDENPTPLVGTE